jgi:hypothetical protein
MNREVQVRFCENAGVKLPCMTRLATISNHLNINTMKERLVVFIGLLAFCAVGKSQENGILKDTRKYALIFLSQTEIVKNKDYPASLKDKIIEFKNGLNKDSAENIISHSIYLADSLYPGIDSAFIDNGLNINLKVVFDDGTKSETSSGGYLTTTRTTEYYHYESRPVLVPYSDIVNVYIRKNKEKYSVEFWTKFYVAKRLSKMPYYGQNKFEFKIKSGTEEVALIASLLYLCNSIKSKD